MKKPQLFNCANFYWKTSLNFDNNEQNFFFFQNMLYYSRSTLNVLFKYFICWFWSSTYILLYFTYKYNSDIIMSYICFIFVFIIHNNMQSLVFISLALFHFWFFFIVFCCRCCYSSFSLFFFYFRKFIPLVILEEGSYEKDVLFYVNLGEPQMVGGNVLNLFIGSPDSLSE